MALPAEPTPADIAGHLADRFDEAGLAYAIGGALALGAWGVPRATADVDVAVFVGEAELDRVIDALERAGAMVDPREAGRTVTKTGMFLAELARTRVDVFLAHHPWHADVEQRRVAVDAPDGKRRWFLSPEDLAVAKLIYSRPKDVADLERLFAVQQHRLDHEYIGKWLALMIAASDSRHRTLADLVARFPS